MLEKLQSCVGDKSYSFHSTHCYIDRMQLDEVVSTVPTVGFNVETLRYKNITFQVWDLGGQTSIRPYWRCYYHNTGNSFILY